MFAATLQPSRPSRPKTNVTLTLYFLKLSSFGLNQIFVGSTSSELQHSCISKITTEPKKKKKKNFGLNLEVLLIDRSHMFIVICLNLKLWIHKNILSQLQGHENWAYFYLVVEANNGHFSVFYASWKIDWSNFFSYAHQKKIMICDLIKIQKYFTK